MNYEKYITSNKKNKIMVSSKYMVFDGNLILSGSEMRFDICSLFNGEIISEFLFASGTNVFFLKEHYDNISNTLLFFDMELPADFSLTKLNRLISRLLNANKFLNGAIIDFLFFKNKENDNNKTSFFIFSRQTENSKYIFNRSGLKLGLLTSIKKPLNILSQFRFTNDYLYHHARKFIKENNFNDCLILNENDCIVETVDSNLFFTIGNHVYYPSPEEGSSRNIMQGKINDLALELGYKVIKGCNFKYNDIFNVDEIFLVDDISGIRWVVAFENKRFYNKISSNLFSNINLILKDNTNLPD